jgi:ADP-heptose:LPS heptosyltransferase
MKRQLKDAEIHYLTKKAFAGIVSSNPNISKVYSIEKDIDEVMPQLRAEKYDHIVDLHHNLRTAVVKSKLRVPATTFNKLNLQKWLLVNFKLDRMPALHIVDRYMEAVNPLGVINDNEGLDYFIAPKNEIDVSSLGIGGAEGSRTPWYIAFVIGAKHNTKQLPEEKIISICRMINSPVVLLGGKEDAAKGGRIAAAAGAHVLNACGKYNLDQSASLVRQAKKVITHDTGLMHIAAAFKKNILSVWGNTVPEFGMYPYKPAEGSALFEVKGLSCRPCSKIGYAKCPRGHFKCMNLISEEAVAAEANAPL